MKTKENKIINKENSKVEMKTQNKGIESDIEIVRYDNGHTDIRIQEIQSLSKEEQQILNDEIGSFWNDIDEEETLIEETKTRNKIEIKDKIENKAKNEITNSFVEKLNERKNNKNKKDKEMGI